MAKRKWILIIDHDRQELQILRQALEIEGYDVATATDGESGLDLLDENNTSLVIIDIIMTGLYGFELLRTIRKRSNAPMIILSTMAEHIPSLEKVFALGADDYVRKPFYMRELIARIHAILRRFDTEVKQEE